MGASSGSLVSRVAIASTKTPQNYDPLEGKWNGREFCSYEVTQIGSYLFCAAMATVTYNIFHRVKADVSVLGPIFVGTALGYSLCRTVRDLAVAKGWINKRIAILTEIALAILGFKILLDQLAYRGILRNENVYSISAFAIVYILGKCYQLHRCGYEFAEARVQEPRAIPPPSAALPPRDYAKEAEEYYVNKDYTSALHFYEELSKQNRPWAVREKIVLCHYHLKQYGHAVKLLQSVRLSPVDAMYSIALEIAFRASDFQLLHRLFSCTINMPTLPALLNDNPFFLCALADDALLASRFDQAFTHISKALEMLPNDPQILQLKQRREKLLTLATQACIPEPRVPRPRPPKPEVVPKQYIKDRK